MDYEVFLLSRIRELYDQTGDNTAAVAGGLLRTGSVITGLAFLLVPATMRLLGRANWWARARCAACTRGTAFRDTDEPAPCPGVRAGDELTGRARR